jgi:hypothetical protein
LSDLVTDRCLWTGFSSRRGSDVFGRRIPRRYSGRSQFSELLIEQLALLIEPKEFLVELLFLLLEGRKLLLDGRT